MDDFWKRLEYLHAKDLARRNIISEIDKRRIRREMNDRTFSLGGEVAAFLSAGVILLTTGVGILVYKHIDSLGHIVQMTLLSLIVLIGFSYAFRKAPGYHADKVESPGTGFDYILLLSSVLILTLFQYLNFQTDIFGNSGFHYLFGGSFLLFIAYYFDHAGVLSVAISAFAAFFGIRLNALGFLDHMETVAAIIALIFSIGLEVTGCVLESKKIKAHFRFTYTQFSLHLFFVSSIFLISENDLWFLIPFSAAAGVYWYLKYSMKEKSFYLSFFILIYAYIIATIFLARILGQFKHEFIFAAYLILLYFIGSGIFGIKYMKKLYKVLSR